MNVSGHRIGTMEVESALVSHKAVAESAVIGRHDEDKGQAIVAYVILEGDREGSEELIKELNDQVRKAIGPHARPEEIIFTPTCRRRGAARSCAASSAASPRARTTWGMSRPSPTPPSWMSSRRPVARASANCRVSPKTGAGLSRLRPDPCRATGRSGTSRRSSPRPSHDTRAGSSES